MEIISGLNIKYMLIRSVPDCDGADLCFHKPNKKTWKTIMDRKMMEKHLHSMSKVTDASDGFVMLLLEARQR